MRVSGSVWEGCGRVCVSVTVWVCVGMWLAVHMGIVWLHVLVTPPHLSKSVATSLGASHLPKT